ncbi:polyphosphate kinase 1 [Beggiatoa alba B18LD]|uniref:Polyphosphate kinase n=1 Tax=Beggiatoa alba B18LD TaxID=395493 RepID=I3CBH2_9GAMM|nr:polyphosphate kinase 1 [Beggiatoa alba]EIJ40965.1 polyphosphate kinase 1 [Beggiatoa alba B18LD]
MDNPRTEDPRARVYARRKASKTTEQLTTPSINTNTMEEIDLNRPDLYINRELSLLAFHRRVLAQAKDTSKPLLERLRFLCIASSNLDEFYEVRVAGLKEQVQFGSVQTGADNLSPQEILNRISIAAHDFVDEQYRLLNNEIIPSLEKENIYFLKRDQWNETQNQWIRDYFNNELLPILSPIGLDPAHPFPRILNKSLNFIVSLKGKDAFGRNIDMAVVQAPRALPRLISLPAEASQRPQEFVFLSSIIHAHVADLFPGMEVLGCYQFRLTRNSDLFVDEEEVDDLLRALEGELPGRRYGDSVRLEVADNCPEKIVNYLLKKFQLEQRELFQVNGPVNLGRLIAIPDMLDRPELKYPSFTSGLPKNLGRNLFATIREGDVLLHHPFQSFTPVIDFVRQAAADPQVLAIKQTLYRTGPDSVLVDALVEAAKAGKEITVVVELRARFDEEANIRLANRLQEAGAHVVYGVVGFKTHAKIMMIIRREGKKLRRYVHLGTGNYHAKTARIYTDYGLFTCDEDIGEDVHKIFMQLTSLGRNAKMRKMLQAPFTLHSGMIERIAREAENAKEGKPAHIIVKVNALTEAEIIRSLYRASMAGVKIDLIVRGICCLRPGVEGISENIHVRSVVGRFLEHTRCFYFHNDGKPEVYCASADWMDRNLLKRVEECFPIEHPELKERVIEQGLKLYLADNTQAWVLDSEGNYTWLKPKEGEAPISAQTTLLQHLTDKA